MKTATSLTGTRVVDFEVAEQHRSDGYTVDITVYHLVSRLLFAAKKFKEATSVTEAGLKRYPNDDQLVLRVATILAVSGHKDFALKTAADQLSRAIKLAAPTRLVAAQLYSLLKMDQDAVPLYESIVRETPNLSLEPYARLALHYTAIGEKAKAKYWDELGERKMSDPNRMKPTLRHK
jgi:tetratricopeptide (TPR) repeat protein